MSIFCTRKPSHSLMRPSLFITGLTALSILASCSRFSDESAQVQKTTPLAKVAGAAAVTPLSAALDATDVYSYSMLAPGADDQTIVYARIIFDAPKRACPDLNGSDGSVLQTKVRPMYPGAITTAAMFPVTVCEAVMSEGVAYSHSNPDLYIDAVSLNVATVHVFGDSGCVAAHCEGASVAVKFQALADLAANEPPDVILHAGDYNYRGTSVPIKDHLYAYNAGDGSGGGETCGLQEPYHSQNARNARPDLWANWQADFFAPGANLLPRAPWVFARGNHELCSRAGPGWFYFLGPGSSLPGSGLPQMQCPDQGDFSFPPSTAQAHIVMIPPYMVSLQDLDVWVMDSANACDGRATNALTSQYQSQ